MDFEWFFGREYDHLVRSLTLAFGDRHTAEDAAQEGFSRAHLRWARVGAMDRPAAWVYVVALRYERRRIQRTAKTRPLPAESEPSADEAQSAANRITVFELLNGLTDRQRRAVVLRYHADLSQEQIAAALGCTAGTVKATLHQALQRLRTAAEERECTDADM